MLFTNSIYDQFWRSYRKKNDFLHFPLFFYFCPLQCTMILWEYTRNIIYLQIWRKKSKLFFVKFVEILMWWQYYIGGRANYTVLRYWFYSITWDPQKWLRIRCMTPNSQSKIWPPNATSGINNDSAPKIVFLMSLPDGFRFQT